MQERLKFIRKNFGSRKIGEVTVDQTIGTGRIGASLVHMYLHTDRFNSGDGTFLKRKFKIFLYNHISSTS